MKRTQISFDYNTIPSDFAKILEGCDVYDSSCSQDARVWYFDKGDGFYLKRAAVGTLKTEAEMTKFFHKKSLAAVNCPKLCRQNKKDHYGSKY